MRTVEIPFEQSAVQRCGKYATELRWHRSTCVCSGHVEPGIRAGSALLARTSAGRKQGEGSLRISCSHGIGRMGSTSDFVARAELLDRLDWDRPDAPGGDG